MKSENIYELTRISNAANLTRLERQMSGRRGFLNIKSWEIEGLRRLVENLCLHVDALPDMRFFYSFQIPKLGKEFDLLRISDDMIINIELKSEPVPDESIHKQLVHNRYYLATLGRAVRSYTYISSSNRLVRLTNGGRIVEADWETLCQDLLKQNNLYDGDIEALFKEEQYIISPIANADRFLAGEYFLTSQQKDFKKKVLKRISSAEGASFQGITGLPGTGKTLLLYDIAMKLSESERICVLHCGNILPELNQLDARLKRIDFFPGCEEQVINRIGEVKAILVDEAHRITKSVLDDIFQYATAKGIPMIFSYDCEDAICGEEIADCRALDELEMPDYVEYRLTNRIRANAELSTFIQCVMQGSRYNHRKDYPDVRICFANDETEAQLLLTQLTTEGFTYIHNGQFTELSGVGALEATSCEYERVVMLMNEVYYYDELHALRSTEEGSVRKLFHGLNRAKTGLAILVMNNEAVLDVLLTIVQGYAPDKYNR